MTVVVPHNADVEAALVGRLLRQPDATGEIIGTLLAPEHFHLAAHRLLFAAIVESFYADETVDPIVIGELHAKRLSKLWSVDERTAVQRVVAIAQGGSGAPADLARLVKRDADYRQLLKLADDVRDRVLSERESPEEIAGVTSQMAMQIAMAQALTSELVSFEDAGRAFVHGMRTAMAAKAQGIELGAYYGLKAIDGFVKGHKPGELIMAGGEPGVGKALALDTLLATPGGWTTQGDVRPGGLLFDENGDPCTVEAVTPVWRERTCFAVGFSDGESIVCDAEHEWVLAFGEGTAEVTRTAVQMRAALAAGWPADRVSRDRLRRTVVSVSPVASVPVRCIQVSSASGLYLAGERMVPTHNSAVWWKAALTFARRQSKRPPGQRIATLIVSLEMSPEPSNARFASMLAGVAGDRLREGTLSSSDLQRIINRWREERGIPLYMNYAPTLRASQLRALVSEGIRRHNVGVVVIDHFRMWDLDQRLQNKLDEDEEKVRFLKEQLARSLNVAVICLAHTRKPDQGSNGRPKMSDLRGSYQVAAHSDMVGFIFRPAMYASQTQIDVGDIKVTDAEIIWAKQRQGSPGTAPFYFDGASMLITDE